jgi:hypothetical protein
VRFDADIHPDAPGLSPEEIAALAEKREVELVRLREEAVGRQERGEELLAWQRQYPVRPIYNNSQGWYQPVPVLWVDECAGPKCDRRVRNFLTVDRIGSMPTFNIEEEIARACDGRSGDFICFLGADWRFGEIDGDASRRSGHAFEGNHYESIAEYVVRATYDLEDAFLLLHPNASSAAVAAFWRSWQVQQHIAHFSGRLAKSPTAWGLVSRVDAVGNVERTRQATAEVERVRWYVYRQLAVFAHEAAGQLPSRSAAGEISAEVVPQKRGRGRPAFPNSRKEAARQVKGNRERAKILYNTSYPTPQQVKNVGSIMRHYERARSLPLK